MAARRPNTRLRWHQPNHSSVILQDTWSIDEITIYKRPLEDTVFDKRSPPPIRSSAVCPMLLLLATASYDS